MDTVDALEAALARTVAVVDLIGPADHARPTVCGEWDLGALLGHVVGATEAFATVLHGGPTPARGRVEPDEATSTRLRDAATRAIAGWRTPGALEREYDSVIELDGGVLIPPIPLPGSMFLSINLLDVGVHVHDLAAAIDRPELAADDGIAEATLDAARLILQPGIRELAGFGPERVPAPDAGAVRRLLAFVGR